MNELWVKIESWHLVAYRANGEVATLCGRYIDETESDPVDFAATLGAEKSCENCLRVAARRTLEGVPA